MKTSSPVLSIGMIVKNEARCLKKCLDALSPLRKAIPCELVIADTGSTDGTREIAEKYADVLFDFEWCDDFSAARNAVIDRCSGKWFITVDADEYLDKDFSELVKFLTTNESDKFGVAFIVIRNYHTFEMLPNDYVDFYAQRMFRMATGTRYEGLVHEELIAGSDDRSILLPTVIFHHDGYGKVAETGTHSKGSRNLPLLEKELEKHPNDLRRIVQCIESSYTDEQEKKYAYMAARVASDLSIDEETHWRAAAFKSAIILAAKYGFYEFDEWVQKAREICPKDFQVLVDIPFTCARHYMTTGNYERSLKEVENYWKGVRYYEADPFNRESFSALPVHNATLPKKYTIYIIQSFCNAKLEKWKEALGALKKVELIKSDDPECISNFVICLTMIWQGCDDIDPSPLLLREWKEIEKCKSGGNTKLYDIFAPLCIQAFGQRNTKQPKRENRELFAKLGKSCDLGRAGLIAVSDSKEEIERLLNTVDNWKLFPYEALNKALHHNAELPPSFYSLPYEIIESHARGIVSVESENVESFLIELNESQALNVSPGKVLFNFLAGAAAVQKINWKQGSWELFNVFCAQTKTYFDTFVSPTVCTDESISTLPSMARFGWYLAKASEAIEANDKVNYVHYLREGLKANAAMSDMVTFLTEQVKNTAETPKAPVSEEMLALAAKLRTVLTQLPQNDPTVLQIKSSDAYKMVAHIIESE